jgi:16S rRNA processing protein RimM
MSFKTEYLIIGKIVKPFGVKGEIKVFPITDSVSRFEGLSFVYLQNGSSFDRYDVNQTRLTNEYVLLKLKGLDSRTDADKLRGEYIYVDRENAVKLEDSSYYYYDLLDCKVITTEGKQLGIVYDIQNAGSCDVYFVRTSNKVDNEVLIPAVSQVVKNIDIKNKEITIDLIDGLL